MYSLFRLSARDTDSNWINQRLHDIRYSLYLTIEILFRKFYFCSIRLFWTQKHQFGKAVLFFRTISKSFSKRIKALDFNRNCLTFGKILSKTVWKGLTAASQSRSGGRIIMEKSFFKIMEIQIYFGSRYTYLFKNKYYLWSP